MNAKFPPDAKDESALIIAPSCKWWKKFTASTISNWCPFITKHCKSHMAMTSNFFYYCARENVIVVIERRFLLNIQVQASEEIDQINTDLRASPF